MKKKVLDLFFGAGLILVLIGLLLVPHPISPGVFFFGLWAWIISLYLLILAKFFGNEN